MQYKKANFVFVIVTKSFLFVEKDDLIDSNNFGFL